MSKSPSKSPKLLLILDGFGLSEPHQHNAITQANTPNWDQLWQERPHLAISASGQDVGLPHAQMGNSEVGHMNIGAGRIIYQDLTKISLAIENKTFFQNTALIDGMKAAIDANKTVHLMGLVSDGGVHSHIEHFYALIELALQLGAKSIALHCFLDGRDTPPKSALEFIQALDDFISENPAVFIASVSGRFYAMDRDNRWERIEKSYQAIAHGLGEHSPTPRAAIENAYAQDITDEFILPTICNTNYKGMSSGDALIFSNFRADRAIEISQAFWSQSFQGFERNLHEGAQKRSAPVLGAFITMTHYSNSLDAPCAFPPETIEDTIGQVVSDAGLKQLRLSETEKYAHVTFFMNAGVETPWPQEERLLIPSPPVKTYDEAPAMSLEKVTDALCEAIEQQETDLIICNFANADMVGHTGNLEATIEAIEAIDLALGRVVSSLNTAKGEALITADHGNAELMVNQETGQPHTAHTNFPIPLVYVGDQHREFKAIEDGRLSDLAPSMLSMMQIPTPKAMTGRNLLK